MPLPAVLHVGRWTSGNMRVWEPRIEAHHTVGSRVFIVEVLRYSLGLLAFITLRSSIQPITARETVKWVTASGLSNNNNDDSGCRVTTTAYRRTHGRNPLAIGSRTEWTLAMIVTFVKSDAYSHSHIRTLVWNAERFKTFSLNLNKKVLV